MGRMNWTRAQMRYDVLTFSVQEICIDLLTLFRHEFPAQEGALYRRIVGSGSEKGRISEDF